MMELKILKHSCLFYYRFWVQKYRIGTVRKISKRFGVVQRTRAHHSWTFLSRCYLRTLSWRTIWEGSSSIHLPFLQYILCTLCWGSNDWEKGKQHSHETCMYNYISLLSLWYLEITPSFTSIVFHLMMFDLHVHKNISLYLTSFG